MHNEYDDETLIISFFCEGFGDDEFELEISIPLDIGELIFAKEGAVFGREAKIIIKTSKPERDNEE
jgi:hypothetical protein